MEGKWQLKKKNRDFFLAVCERIRNWSDFCRRIQKNKLGSSYFDLAPPPAENTDFLCFFFFAWKNKKIEGGGEREGFFHAAKK